MGLTPTESYHILIRQGVPADDALKLVATGKSESGWNPTIAGDGGQSIGLYQIHMPAHWDKLTRLTGSAEKSDWIRWLEDPVNNTIIAAEVYHSQGLGAWTEFKNKRYEKYLDTVDLTGYDTGKDGWFIRDIWQTPKDWAGGNSSEKMYSGGGSGGGGGSAGGGRYNDTYDFDKKSPAFWWRILFIVMIVIIVIVAGFKAAGGDPGKLAGKFI